MKRMERIRNARIRGTSSAEVSKPQEKIKQWCGHVKEEERQQCGWDSDVDGEGRRRRGRQMLWKIGYGKM